MCGLKEFETRLDKIPPSYPYELVQLLREAHELLHRDRPQSIQEAIVNIQDIKVLREQFKDFEPSDLAKARQRILKAMEITETNLTLQGNEQAMNTIIYLYVKHLDPYDVG